jgi:hypothetical protein
MCLSASSLFVRIALSVTGVRSVFLLKNPNPEPDLGNLVRLNLANPEPDIGQIRNGFGVGSKVCTILPPELGQERTMNIILLKGSGAELST